MLQQRSSCAASRPSHASRARCVAVRAGGPNRGLLPLIEDLTAQQQKPGLPTIRVGDGVRLGVLVQEGKGKTRTQRVEGTVIATSGTGAAETFTTRRVFQGVGVELTVPVCAPVLGSVEVTRRGRVRRAKLYYLRDRQGKNARLRELLGVKALAMNAADAATLKSAVDAKAAAEAAVAKAAADAAAAAEAAKAAEAAEAAEAAKAAEAPAESA
jgi:large subunit ribosomal protein L19